MQAGEGVLALVVRRRLPTGDIRPLPRLILRLKHDVDTGIALLGGIAVPDSRVLVLVVPHDARDLGGDDPRIVGPCLNRLARSGIDCRREPCEVVVALGIALRGDREVDLSTGRLRRGGVALRFDAHELRISGDPREINGSIRIDRLRDARTARGRGEDDLRPRRRVRHRHLGEGVGALVLAPADPRIAPARVKTRRRIDRNGRIVTVGRIDLVHVFDIPIVRELDLLLPLSGISNAPH